MKTLKDRKGSFGGIRFASILIVIVFCWSCHNNEKDNQQLLQEQISNNLLIGGDTDPALLIGAWEALKFAYTEDGKVISNEKPFSMLSKVYHPYKTLLIRNEDPLNYIFTREAPPDLFGPWNFLNEDLFYTKSDNLIKYWESNFLAYMIMIHVTEEGEEALKALKNAYSFVIKGDELFIYFTGVKNKNLIIFEKR